MKILEKCLKLQICFSNAEFIIYSRFSFLSIFPGPLKKKCQCKNRECSWTPSDKSYCRKNPVCPRIQIPENGRIECPVDSICVVSCDEGFEMENGIMEKTMKCNCDFENYLCQWDYKTPVCKRM